MSSVGIQKSEPAIKKCKTCQHANTKTNPVMAAQGYATCNLGPKWEFHAPRFVCGKWKSKQ
jgi:hypothetical protein